MVARHNFSEKLARRVCELVSEGESLATIAKMPGMPARRSVRDWLLEHPDFAASYETAKRQRCDNLIDEAIEIADSVRGNASIAAVAAARLQVDTRKWLASKLLPERFGDRLEHVGAGGSALLPPETDRSKVALVLLSILKNARPELEVVDEAEVLEPAPEPRRLLLSDEPRDEALLVVEPPPPLPSPRWTSDARGQTRHVSEQRDLFPVRVVK